MPILGLDVTDTHNEMRAFTRAAAAKLRIRNNGMWHASEILEQIAKHQLRFVEVPVQVRCSEHSLRKGQRSIDVINILWERLFHR